MTTPQEETRKNMLQKLKTSQEAPVMVDAAKENFNSDYEYTRKKLKNLVDMGEEAIEHFKDIAEETNEPRAFEVLATLLKNTGELVRGVIDNATSKANIDGHSKENKVVGDKEVTTNNTTIFVGTTRDLLDKLNNEQKSKVIDVEPKEII